MATVKVSTTKNGTRAMNYAEKRATVKDGLNCEINNAKNEMATVRSFYNKTDNIQAHLVIQSFSHDESQQLGAEKINQLGIELAQKIAPNHQIAVYTHTDKEHFHNHIVMNSVNFSDGSKYHQHHFFDHVKTLNDELAKEHGLNIVTESALERKTIAEIKLEEKGQIPWKQEIRNAVDSTMGDFSVTSYERFKECLNEKGIDVTVRGKNVTYELLDSQNKVRGTKLGEDYQKEPILTELNRRFGLTSENSIAAEAKKIRSNEIKMDANKERENQQNETLQQKQTEELTLERYRGISR
ncbi:relaxase/mobilization nuclease domain-containing protein [Vagococcus fluvialis]|uniref:relaxase/mobilization nuclease domain-containing protein n=1 Tax=Vagococcus fluvialis TaxID=2738 RepID=UPI001A8F0574|nr:relaxase/mobilization nuclease domain-containing protein [Vagococcus fluvialis]MBO0488525.1 relaxase/mobilization nuclease domain-containing protein [Vagococcus fluvialis]